MLFKIIRGILPALLFAAVVFSGACKDQPKTTDEIAEDIQEQKEDVADVNKSVHRCNEHSSKTCVILVRCALSEKRPAKLQECLAEAKIQASCSKTDQGLCCDECDHNSCVTSCTIP